VKASTPCRTASAPTTDRVCRGRPVPGPVALPPLADASASAFFLVHLPTPGNEARKPLAMRLMILMMIPEVLERIARHVHDKLVVVGREQFLECHILTRSMTSRPYLAMTWNRSKTIAALGQCLCDWSCQMARLFILTACNRRQCSRPSRSKERIDILATAAMVALAGSGDRTPLTYPRRRAKNIRCSSIALTPPASRLSVRDRWSRCRHARPMSRHSP